MEMALRKNDRDEPAGTRSLPPGQGFRTIRRLPGARSHLAIQCNGQFHLPDHVKGAAAVFIGAEKSVSVSNIYIQGRALYFTESSNLFRIPNKDQASDYKHPERIFTDSVQASEIASGVVDRNGALIQSMKKNESSYYFIRLVWK